MRENRCKVPMGKRKVGTIAEAMTVFYRVEDIFESQVDYEEGITIKKINEICLENVNYAFDNSNIIIIKSDIPAVKYTITDGKPLGIIRLSIVLNSNLFIIIRVIISKPIPKYIYKNFLNFCFEIFKRIVIT